MTRDTIIDRVDEAINELVVDKWRLLKAYNYYNGKRDAEQFRYIEENFGIGNPTSVEFTPLIKKHVDALIGEYLNIPILPKVSCKDKNTISNINRDLQISISSAVYKYLQQFLNNEILSFIGGKNPTVDINIQNKLDKIIEETHNDFISEYEIAAQNVLEYCIQSRNIDLPNKLRLLLLDLLVSGCAFYRVKPSSDNTNIIVEVLNPLNTFIDKNPESPYVRDGYRAVIRKWMTKDQILSEYGKEMSKEAISELKDIHDHYTDHSHFYIRVQPNTKVNMIYTGDAQGLDAGKTVVPGYPTDDMFDYKLIPVYEIEWIETDKENGEYVENRYEAVKIGDSIYIPRGKSKNIIRTQDAKSKCSLSVNGIFLTNRDNIPQSLVLQCVPMQDRYDLVIYLRDNILANSGTAGDWIDVSVLPTWLGADATERIEKFLAYKKTGAAFIDTSQEGRAFNNNTTFSGFDDAIRVQTMHAFDIVLARIEDQTSSISGVFRERLNGIEQRDAVSNVEAGARNSYTITKPFYQQMDTVATDILYDCLNMAKIVWKDGLTGTLVLGDKLQKTFTALPEYFTLTDYDIHIVPSTQILRDFTQMQGLVFELIKGGLMEPDTAVEAMTARSLTELKDKVQKAWAKKKKENDQLGQLQQQLQQLDQQNKQLTQTNQQLQAKLEQFNEARIQLERERLKADIDIGWYNAHTEREFKSAKSEVEQKKVDIELGQLYDGNPYNNQIRFQ